MANLIVHSNQAHYQETPNATPVFVGAFTVPVNSIAKLEAEVLARTSAGVRATWKIYGSAGRESGSASLISAILNIVNPRQDLGAATWTATVALNGNDLGVQVSGALATTISWVIITNVIIFTP